MNCSGCGKDIPFSGHVCPFCQRDKSQDKQSTMAVGCGLLIGGGLGYLISGFTGLLIGGFVIGTIAAVISAPKAINAGKKAPAVRITKAANERPITAKPGSPSVEERLRKLDELHTAGIITPDEHATKRKAIIDSL